MPKIGILAIQGDYEKHKQALEKLNQEALYVRNISDLKKCDALIMPGGESTTVRKLLKDEKYGFWEELKGFGKRKPIMGTCAGLILLAKEIKGGEKDEDTLGLIDITIGRNAYGRQINSFEGKGKVNVVNGPEFEMVFIRAPKILEVGKETGKIGFLEDDVVMVQNEKILAMTFHPELTSDTRIHEYFLKKFLNVDSKKQNKPKK